MPFLKHFSLFCILSIGIINICFSQTIDSLADKHANEYFNKGIEFMQMGEVDSLIKSFKQASYIYEEIDSLSDYKECYKGIAYYYYIINDYNSSILYIDTILNHIEEKVDSINLKYDLRADLYDFKASNYQALGLYREALNFNNLALKEQKRVIPIDSIRLAEIFNNAGTIYRNIGDLHPAIEYYHQAIKFYNTKKELVNLSIAYNNLGIGYYDDLKYHDAIKWQKKAFTIVDSLFLTRKKDYLDNQNLIEQYIITCNNLGLAYYRLEDYNNSISFLNKALEIKNKTAIQQVKELQYIYLNLGVSYNEIGNANKAKENLEIALQIAKQQYGESHPNLAVCYIGLSTVLAKQGKNKLALQNFQLALKALSKDFVDDKQYNNPDIRTVSSQVKLLRILEPKAKNLFQLYKKEQNKDLLLAAFESYLTIDQLYDYMRSSYLSESSRHMLANRVVPIYEQAIKICLELANVTDDEQYKHKAFYFAEKTKVLSLLETVSDTEQKMFAQIKDAEGNSLLDQEKEVKRELAFYELNLFKEKQKAKNANKTRIDNWEDEIFNLKRKNDQITTQLKEQFPAYINLKYSFETADISSIREKLLDDQSMLIEYFYGDSAIYTFAITDHDFDIYKIRKDSFIDQHISTIRNQLKQASTDGKQYQQLSNSSFYLYNQLLKNTLTSTNDSINKLLIIPDNILGYIPFEVLLQNQPTANDNFVSQMKAADYLFKDYQINYAYSANLQLEQATKKSIQNHSYNYLGFAPSFSEVNKNNPCATKELLHNQETVSKVNKTITGKTFLGDQANKNQFFKHANGAQILHLQTHACIDESDPMMNQIFFHDEAAFTYEIYNQELNADLAVLSACNTGSGELLRGEGIMSLARAFTYAGCPSIVTSLWEANEATTESILLYFYQNLKAGQEKDEALRNAKLDFLSNSSQATIHPFYWAGFVHIGDDHAMEIKDANFPISKMLIGIAFILFTLLGYKYFRK